LVSALAEMYVQGVSTRKVKSVTEQLCGHSFSASSVSEMNKILDAALTAFATRRLDEPYPYLILDARYERARERQLPRLDPGSRWLGRRGEFQRHLSMVYDGRIRRVPKL
jgi:putative transposase